jgi:hypothetical protein
MKLSFVRLCGLTWKDSAMQFARWTLTGVSTTRLYRPILDISALRTGRSSENVLRYYQFRFDDGQRT